MRFHEKKNSRVLIKVNGARRFNMFASTSFSLEFSDFILLYTLHV